jgi:hypothetical protein
MGKEIKDVVGKIAQITAITSKDFTAHKGKNAGKKFTIYSLGIKMDDGNWYNIKANSEDKINEMMLNTATQQLYKVGQEIKIYLEAEDEEGKYWKISSMKLNNPMDSVEEEFIEDDAGYDDPQEELVADPKPVSKMTGQGPTSAQLKGIKETPKLAPAVPAKTPEEKAKEQEVRENAALKFKEEDSDKYELGMAKNNAAVIFAATIPSDFNPEDHAGWFKNNFDLYDKIVESLYSRGKTLRKKHLGY